MGCVGNGLACTEREVSICVKDSAGPYSYQTVTGLIRAAKENGIGSQPTFIPSTDLTRTPL